MPTIALRNITKRFGPRAESTLKDLVRGSTRFFDSEKKLDYLESHRARPEPPDRDYALYQLSLAIRNGETLSLVGPSGCGKTTLLKVIAGLVDPDEGEILYDNVPLQQIPRAERGIGMVFQTYALYPHLDAYTNIGFFDLIRRQPEKIPERIRHISTIMGVDIQHLLSRKPPTLSGGEQQRVAVARCLARDPKLFLFDEPLSNLDAKLRTQTRVQIKRLLRHYGITAVYVTHDQVEAVALADRIAVMRAGHIEQVGTYPEVYRAPVNVFVAEFLGNPSMNLFLGRACEDCWEGKGFVVRPIRRGLRVGQGVWLGIRPEDVIVGEVGVQAQIELIEPIITDQIQLVYLQIAGESCVARVPIDQKLEIGTSVHVQFPVDKIALFDRETEIRIS